MLRDVIKLILQNEASLSNQKTIVDQTKDGWTPEWKTRRKVSKKRYVHLLFVNIMR